MCHPPNKMQPTISQKRIAVYVKWSHKITEKSLVVIKVYLFFMWMKWYDTLISAGITNRGGA